MLIRDTEIAGVRLIEAEPSADDRGTLTRLYCAEAFAAAGIDFSPVQVNLSHNATPHTLRGLHFQAPPRAEAKLVHVVRGAIFDVALDLRRNSPTYRRWSAFTLDAVDMAALFIPEGCAHGFLTLEAETDVLYHMGRTYEPGWGLGVRWNDPAFSIEWPASPAVISERDATYPDFEIK